LLLSFVSTIFIPSTNRPRHSERLHARHLRAKEKNIPLSQAEEDAVEKKHTHAVIYQ